MTGPPHGFPRRTSQRVAQHRDPVGLAGAVVAHRRAGRAISSAAAATTSRVHGRPHLLGGQRADRRGRHPAQADPDRFHRSAPRSPARAVREPQRVGHGDPGDVVEPALGDLVERADRGDRQRDADRLDQLIRALDGLPVTGEVIGQPDLALALARGQDQGGVQREQRGRGVADRRGGAEVAAERGPVADQPGRELREHLVEQRHPAGQPGLDLGQAQRGADVDVVAADRELAQLGDPLDADGQRGPGVPDVQLDAPVGGPGHQLRVRARRPAVRGPRPGWPAAGSGPARSRSRWSRGSARARSAGPGTGRPPRAGRGRRPRP